MNLLIKNIMVVAGFSVLALAVPNRADAHAILIDSQPALEGHVSAGKVEFHLRYNSRIDEKRSRLVLMLPDKSKQVLPLANEATDDVLVSAATLPPGAYSLRWQVLAVDGHITRGDINFNVEQH